MQKKQPNKAPEPDPPTGWPALERDLRDAARARQRPFALVRRLLRRAA